MHIREHNKCMTYLLLSFVIDCSSDPSASSSICETISWSGPDSTPTMRVREGHADVNKTPPGMVIAFGLSGEHNVHVHGMYNVILYKICSELHENIQVTGKGQIHTL